MLLADSSVLTEQHIDIREDLRETELQFLLAVDNFSHALEDCNKGELLEKFRTAKKRLRDMFHAREQLMLTEGSLLRDAFRQQHRLVMRTVEHLHLNLDLGIPDAGNCVIEYFRSL